MDHILIVEDEQTIAESLQFALQQDGFNCSHVTTALAAIDLIEKQPFAAVILDVGLPDMTGFECCKKIRKRSALPILFLTARADEIDRILGLELGGDDYVTKPFSPREVAARMRAILRRGTHVREEEKKTFERLPFTVDLIRFQIRYFGKLLELSAHEFKLLNILIKHPGRVYSREQLMNMVWEDPAMSLERTVDAHIKNLRAKLRAIDSNYEAIVTHRGLGYSLREDW